MSAESVIQEGRAFNEALMRSTIKAFNYGPKDFDRETLTTTIPEVDLYEGKGKIKVTAAAAGISEREPIGQQLAVQVSILSVPVVAPAPDGDTSLIKKNTFVRIIENPEDPGLVGQVYRVKGYHHQTSATARRFIVEQVS